VFSILPQPFLMGDPRLFEQPAQKARSDVAFVLVWNDQRQIPSSHLRVFSPGKRAFKAKLVQPLDEFATGNRSEFRHG